MGERRLGALFMAGNVPGLVLAMIFAIHCAPSAKLGPKPEVIRRPAAVATQVLQ